MFRCTGSNRCVSRGTVGLTKVSLKKEIMSLDTCKKVTITNSTTYGSLKLLLNHGTSLLSKYDYTDNCVLIIIMLQKRETWKDPRKRDL